MAVILSIKENDTGLWLISIANMDKNFVTFFALVACCVLVTSAFDPVTMNGLGLTGNNRFNSINGRGRLRSGLNNNWGTRGNNRGNLRGNLRGTNRGNLRGTNRGNNRGALRNTPGRVRNGKWDVLDHLSLMLPG